MAKKGKKKHPDAGKFRGKFHPLGYWYDDGMRPSNPVKFAAILPAIIAKYGLARKIGFERIERVWREILNETLVDFIGGRDTDSLIRLTGFSRGSIRLEVAGNLLLQEFLFFKTAVLRQFQSSLPQEKIKDISVTVRHFTQ